MPHEMEYDPHLQGPFRYSSGQQNLMKAETLAQQLFDIQDNDAARVRRELENEVPGLDNQAILSVLRQRAERGERQMLAYVLVG
jgi:hypothetical protein